MIFKISKMILFPIFQINLLFLLLLTFILLFYVTDGNTSQLREYYVTCDQAEFDSIIAHPFEEIFIDCELKFEGQLYPHARIKIRGETSREYPKKSFKINFDKNYRFEGRDKINLISEYTDPTFIREFLAYDLYKRAGYFAPIAQHAKLYVNGKYMGLYLEVENVDEFFLARFGFSDEGSLYKADNEGAALQYGIIYEAYYDKKTNDSTGFDDLINFIETIHFTSDENFYNEMNKIVDLERLYELIAINILLANGSTYYHNYYLYHHPEQMVKWTFFPWDMDKTFTYYGSQFIYYNAGYYLLNPFFKKVWLNDTMRQKIGEKVEYLIKNYFTEEYYSNIIDSLTTILESAVKEDIFKRYSYNQFLTKANDIKSYISERSSFVLNVKDHAPYPFALNATPSSINYVELSWQISSDPNGDAVHYILQVSPERFFIDSLTYEFNNITQNSFVVTGLSAGKYYWRVFASDGQLKTKCFDRFRSFTLNVSREWEGVLTENTNWDWKNSPYIITNDIIVPLEVKLNIGENVTILLEDSASILVYGLLNALGRKEKPIIFTSKEQSDKPLTGLKLAGSSPSLTQQQSIEALNTGSTWGSILFINTQQQNKITHSKFYFSKGKSLPDEGISVPATIALHNSSISIDCCQFTQNNCKSIDATKSTILVKNCLFYENEGEAIHTNQSKCFFYDNRIHGLPTGFNAIDLDYKTQDTTISEIHNNKIYNIQDDGIDLIDNNPLIVNNEIFNCKNKAISIGEASNPLIMNNLIYNNKIGIAIKDNSDPTIINNTLYGDSIGIKSYKKNGPTGGRGYVLNTIIWNSYADDIILLDESTITVEYADIKSGWPGTGNISANPLFVDSENSDFRLLPSSPAIDSGHPSIEYFDRDSTRNDMGAFGGPNGLIDTAASTDENNTIPAQFELCQNYPNPFNQKTIIKFNLNKDGQTTLTIYDILGRQVQVLVNKFSYKGIHKVIFDGSSLSSGIYLYQLKFKGKNSYTQINKMILLK